MDEVEFHPIANVFPLIEGEQFRELVEDVRSNGLLEPIVLLDGHILDGRNRYRACIAAQIPARFTLYTGSDPVSFVISTNLRRRHLDASQRALIAARLITGRGRTGPKAPRYVEVQRSKSGKSYHYLKHPGQPHTRLSDDYDEACAAAKAIVERAPKAPAVGTAAASKLLNVSEPVINFAKRVLASGSDRLIGAVSAGEISAQPAAELASLPRDQQDRILASGGPQTVTAIGRRALLDRMEVRRAKRLVTAASEHAVYDHYKVRDGRSLGNVRLGELRSLAVAARKESEILAALLAYYSDPDYSKRVRDVFSTRVLSDVLRPIVGDEGSSLEAETA